MYPSFKFSHLFYASKQLEYGYKIIIENNKHIEQDKENVTHLFTQMCYIFILNNSTTLSFSHFFISKMYHLRTTCCSFFNYHWLNSWKQVFPVYKNILWWFYQSVLPFPTDKIVCTLFYRSSHMISFQYKHHLSPVLTFYCCPLSTSPSFLFSSS